MAKSGKHPGELLERAMFRWRLLVVLAILRNATTWLADRPQHEPDVATGGAFNPNWSRHVAQRGRQFPQPSSHAACSADSTNGSEHRAREASPHHRFVFLCCAIAFINVEIRSTRLNSPDHAEGTLNLDAGIGMRSGALSRGRGRMVAKVLTFLARSLEVGKRVCRLEGVLPHAKVTCDYCGASLTATSRSAIEHVTEG